MSVHRWDPVQNGPFSEAALRRTLEDLGCVVTRYIYEPGTRFPEHVHGVDKVDAVVSGRFQIALDGRLSELGPGDWIEVPRGVPHAAAVLGREAVVSLDGVLRAT